MNYITELNKFYSYCISKKLSKSEIALLHALYMINNAEDWAIWFEADTKIIQRLTGGLSRQGIVDARNKLKQKGRIDFKNGIKNSEAAKYKITPFASSKQELDKELDIQLDIQLDKELDPITKQNINKTKNNKELLCGNSDECHAEEKTKPFAADSVEYLASKYIADKMLEINPNAKIPKTDTDFYKWCIHIDRLLRIDKKDIVEMKLVLKFAMEDPFWSSNIRCTKKFREKYDQLFAKMRTKMIPAKNQSKYTNQLNSLKEWANE